MALIVFVTVLKKEAYFLAELLLKERLCACVNIVEGITSYYWWDNRINKDKEALLIIKTTPGNYKRLEKAIKRNHSYEVPEIIAIKTDCINGEYLKWLRKETGYG